MLRFTPVWLAKAAVAALAVVVAGLSWPSAGASAATADGRLSGRVQNNYGVTVVGADVALVDSATQTPVGRATTDANGAYSLAVPKGTYDATVTAPDVNGTPTVGRLRGVSIGASSKLAIALVPPPDAYPTFSGTVRDDDGGPLAGVSLALSSDNASKTLTTGADGRFSLTVPPGRYSLIFAGQAAATPPGVVVPTNWAYSVSALELTGDRTEDITIPFHDVTVTVRTEDGAPLSSARVLTGSSSTDDTVELFPGADATLNWNFRGTTDATGTVKFVGLSTSSLSLSARPNSSTLGRIRKTMLALTSDSTFDLVAPPLVTFGGVVRHADGSPLASGTVALDNSETGDSASIEADGRFSVRAAKGSYTLHLNSYRTADDIEVIVPIEITGDMTQDLTVPATTLRAHVTDPSGAPVAGVKTSAKVPFTDSARASVTLFPGGTGTGRRQSDRTTDASGNAVLTVFENSTVAVTAHPTDASLASSNPREMTVAWGAGCPGGDRDWSHPVMGQCLAEVALRPAVTVRATVEASGSWADTSVSVYQGTNTADWPTYEATYGAGGSYELRMPVGTFNSINVSTPGAVAGVSHWNISGGPLEITAATTLNLTPPFVQATLRAYGTDGDVLQLGATSYNAPNGSKPVEGSLAPGLPARSGSVTGSGVPDGDTQSRLSVLQSSPFRVEQSYMASSGEGGTPPALRASGLLLAADSDIALVLTAVFDGPPPTTTTTTTTTGGTGPTTSTTGPSEPSTTTTTSTSTTTTTAPVGEAGKSFAPGRSGYWMVTAAGEVHAFGNAKHYGQPRGGLAGARAVDLEPTRSGLGYWILDDRGRVHPYGDARNLGNVHSARLAAGEKAASLSATPAGGGYWIFTDRGRVLTFGDAGFFGDMSKTKLNGPVLGSVATPSGKGYWMVASDGGIFSFGDARFHGSTGKLRLNKPVMGMAPAPGGGYWLVASDGGIFAFDVPFFGSMGAVRLNKPISGMVPGRNGYLMVAEDGGIFSFGDVAFHGSLGANPPASSVVSVALLP